MPIWPVYICLNSHIPTVECFVLYTVRGSSNLPKPTESALLQKQSFSAGGHMEGYRIFKKKSFDIPLIYRILVKSSVTSNLYVQT